MVPATYAYRGNGCCGCVPTVTAVAPSEHGKEKKKKPKIIIKHSEQNAVRRMYTFTVGTNKLPFISDSFTDK